jgi:hypothetical protein
MSFGLKVAHANDRDGTWVPVKTPDKLTKLERDNLSYGDSNELAIKCPGGTQQLEARLPMSQVRLT